MKFIDFSITGKYIFYGAKEYMYIFLIMLISGRCHPNLVVRCECDVCKQ